MSQVRGQHLDLKPGAGGLLVRRGVVADLFVVGGSAMALAYDATRVTAAVDATFVPHGVVLAELRPVAAELGLPLWWLGVQASVYISKQPDGGRPDMVHPVMPMHVSHVIRGQNFFGPLGGYGLALPTWTPMFCGMGATCGGSSPPSDTNHYPTVCA